MRTRTSIAAALALALLTPALAEARGPATAPAGNPDRDAAVAACLAHSTYGPATLYADAPDGTGDWLVWVADRGDDLWLCDANAAGEIFAYIPMYGDLLEGAGSDYLATLVVGGPPQSQMDRAEAVCAAVLPPAAGATPVGSFEDGTGDYLVWLGTAASRYYLCDAAADGALYAFVEIGEPIYRPSVSPPPSDALVES